MPWAGTHEPAPPDKSLTNVSPSDVSDASANPDKTDDLDAGGRIWHGRNKVESLCGEFSPCWFESTRAYPDPGPGIDSGILSLLMRPDNRRLWSKDEIDREIGQDTIDSLNRLYGAGLLHRLDGFVWATRAALIADAIRL